MRKKHDKIPKEWVFCPVCGERYMFIKCRYSIIEAGVRKEMCLHCAVQYKRAKKLSTK